MSEQFKSGIVKLGQVKSGQVKMHLRMEFDSGVGPTCFLALSLVQFLLLLNLTFVWNFSLLMSFLIVVSCTLILLQNLMLF